MEANVFPKDQIEFLQAVLEMREAQRNYFRQPDAYKLKVSKVKEQRVDGLLQPYLRAGVVKLAVRNFTEVQGGLF